MTTSQKDHAVLLEHKIINQQPFLELTLLIEKQPQDRATFSLAEWNTAHQIIKEWMYGKQS